MFGPHRRERIAFLAKTTKRGLGAVKRGRGAAKQLILAKNAEKALEKGRGGSVFGPDRRERIAFFGKLGDARLGRLKAGPGRNKKMHFREKGAKLGEAETCLDRTCASGSPFLRSYANHRKPGQPRIEPEGKAYVKDKTYDEIFFVYSSICVCIYPPPGLNGPGGPKSY